MHTSGQGGDTNGGAVSGEELNCGLGAAKGDFNDVMAEMKAMA